MCARAEAGHGEVLLAHAACGTVADNSVSAMRSGVSLPGGLASTAVSNGMLRGGVLGDITNVPCGAIPGAKSLKHTKVSPIASQLGALGSALVDQASDAMVLTPRCTEDGDIDTATAGDPQYVTEYARDIYGMMSRGEVAFLPQPDYLDAQVDINAKMRAILIDWLVEVHMKYKLKTETLFLAVNLIDRFLSKRSIPRKKLQLVGVTGMLIAAKFEEIYPPEVRDFVYITDKAYTKEEILQMEVVMLTVLEFSINCPTVCHFFERYHRVNRCSEQHRHLLQYVLELTLPDFKMLRYSPSHLAAAATLLSNKLLKQQPSWPPAMVRNTQQTELMVKACAKEMCGLLDFAERSPLQAVRKKFSQPKFSSVSKMTF
jgi:cyclin B|mmetsp:Transcript_89949/g.142133  ORF Transcript_89949/g.142133 Transcript_89949/m.142133 type:complete len:373 (+) Transcript_89949:76-1194(+)